MQSVTWIVDMNRETHYEAVLQNMLGTVSVKQTVTTSGDIPDNVKVGLSSPVLSWKPDVGDDVSGLAVIGDSVCVTEWYQPNLWMHDIGTKTKTQHTIDGLKAVGMTTVNSGSNKYNENNTLVITDTNRKLHFITLSPQHMNITKHTVKDIPFVPRHVSVDSMTGKLMIANYTDKQIVICDTTGNIEKRVRVNTRDGIMRCALATDDGYIVLDCS